MIAQMERMSDLGRSVTGNRPVRETVRTAGIKDVGGLRSGERELPETIPSIRQELDALRREQAKLQQAIYEAAQVQRKLCAPRELVWGEFEIAGEIFPVRHLSGDFFKVMQLGSVLGLALGDIAGKGLTAGIWQAHLMGLIQRAARKHADPATAVAEVNRELCQHQDERPLTALFFARLDSHRNDLVYCNAGLPAPLLVRQDKTVERLEKGGPMLGVVQKAVFSSGRVRLNPSDMLIAYSDGVTECENSREEEFGAGRLAATARTFSSASAQQALFSTLAAVLDFADACPPGDDLTVLVVRRHGAVKQQLDSRSKGLSAPRGRVTSLGRRKGPDRRGNGSK